MNAPNSILLAGVFAIVSAELIPAQVTPTPTATVEPDQIKSFKELVTRFPTRSIGNTGKKTNKAYDIDIIGVTFDVRKTDSLINPIIGTINFTMKETFPIGPKDTFYLQMQMVFHWQGDHWTFHGIWNRENGVDFTLNERWGGPMSDFLKSVQ